MIVVGQLDGGAIQGIGHDPGLSKRCTRFGVPANSV
jgi:hypothetical protein